MQLKLRRCYFVLALLAVSFLAISVSQLWLFFSKSQDLIVLHDTGNGSAWITQQRGIATPTEAATRSNIANYIKMRESYSATSFSHQYRETNKQSSPAVGLEYRRQQSSTNKSSLLRRMGRQGVRKIKVNDVILLPFKSSKKFERVASQHPFAEIHFTSIEMTSLSGIPKIKNHTAILSWGCLGIPEDPEERLVNWMGFKVYYYNVTERQ